MRSKAGRVAGVLRYPISATAVEKPLPRKGPESFPSWTSPVRPRSPALTKGRDSSGLFLSTPPGGPVAAAISQSRKRREDADLSIDKYEICESARRKVATALLPATHRRGDCDAA